MSVDKRGQSWRVRVSLPGGKQRSRSFRRKSDATAWEAEQYATLRRGTWIDPSDKTTVADYARQWVANRPHKPTTAKNVKGMVENHIAGLPLGDRRLASVRPSEVQAWATDRSKVLGPTRCHQLVSLLRSIYRDAVFDRLAAENPVVRVQLPRHDKPRIEPLTTEQVQALTDAMPKRNKAMVVAQAGLGLRIGELIALRVEDVDFLRRVVRVEWQFAPGSTSRTRPKTPKSRRTIPLPQTVADALAAHLAEFPAGEDGTLFTTRFANGYGHAYYGTNIFKAAVRKAKLPPETSTHALRHYFACTLLAAGESVVAVAEWLGHEDATLVLKTYGHKIASRDAHMRQAIDAAFAVPELSKAKDSPL